MKTYFSLLFVASHVILRTVKAVPEYGKRKSRRSTVGGEGGGGAPSSQATNDDENANSQVCWEEIKRSFSVGRTDMAANFELNEPTSNG